MRLVAGVVGLLCLAGGEALAGNRASLGDGYMLSIDSTDAVWVSKGKVKARMGLDASDIKSTKVDKKTKDVTAELVILDCDPTADRTKTWTRAYLDARLENAAAYALHVKKDYAKAAEGFARAVADDPTWEIPAYNLASAKQMSGKPDDAMAALAPWLKSQPLPTFLQIALDPELSPLLSRPELATLRAKTVGTATIDADGSLDGGLAVSPDGSIVAVTRDEHSWGGCNYLVELELYDAKTGTKLAHAPVYGMDDTDGNCDEKPRPRGPAGDVIPKRRAAVAARIARENVALAQLGFAPPAITERGSDGDKPDTARFAKAKLGVATAGDGVFRVLSKDAIVAQGNGLQHIQYAVYVEQPRMVLVQTTTPGREGCEGTDPTGITLIPLPAATIPATPPKPPAPLKPTH